MKCSESIRSFVVLGVCLAGVTSLSAAERVFPNAGGDLASSEAWGADFPGTTDSVEIDKDGTYTAGADLSINSLAVTADDVTLDFSGAAKRTIMFNGDTGTAGANYVFSAMGQGKKMAIKGGRFDSSTGKANVRLLVHTANVRTKPSTLTISDGCVITNINRGLFLSLLDDSTVTMTGGSVIYSTGTFVGTDGGTYRNTMTVNGGSTIYTGSHFYPFNTGCADDQFVLSGSGTKQTCVGTFYWERTTNCVFRISEGASGNFKNVRIGAMGKGNCLTICDSTTAFVSTALNIGVDASGGDGGVGNRVVIENANAENSYGTVSVGGGTGSADNILVVSNCTVKGNESWTIGKNGASGRGNGLVIIGDSSIQNTGKILTVNQGAVYSFDVPENGYSEIPLQFQKFTYNSSDVTIKVNARKYLRRHSEGGRIVLAQANSEKWLDTSVNQGLHNLEDAITALNLQSEKTGCTFSISGKQLLCDIAPAKGLILLFR